MEFWERNFVEKGEMWGGFPAHSAQIAKDFFLTKNIKEILIPGFGYGRNGHIFLENGIDITGIELSNTAIELARKRFGPQTIIYHGSVVDMPFDTKKYDGIFCHGLIHLLAADERTKFIHDCYEQLSDHGYMIFTTVSKQASIYGQGTAIGTDRFEMFGGVNMFFYDLESIQTAFEKYGLIEVREVEENYPFYFITCKK
ncbi:bifunctional 2-polyprenyl-6-hydroxyphenol methylase/3-demethylubiquinol 3-O-methyltransferase UbiG [Sphingobacterium sp. HMA12]|uniref:class I SAM-dependent methyltransferase n=1 Tax=Sphingobacterium sp. HMA12 TaxID=2050894 RepID=UPI000CE9CFD9|nr:class I SAM-dependent methyltransferase [Sphingobacterium sp. HMA12]